MREIARSGIVRTQSLIDALGRLAGRFSHDTSGAIFVMAAGFLLALMIAIGVAIDYSRMASARTEMQNACDAAVLAALRQMQIDGVEPTAGGSGSPPSRGAYAQLAEDIFAANLRATAASYGPAFQLDITETENRIVGTGRFTAEVPLAFGELLPTSTQQGRVASDCTTQIGTSAGIALHFLIDTSMSMGLAADETQREVMRAGTAADARLGPEDRDSETIIVGGRPQQVANGCTFACHFARRGSISTLDWARENNITLRIDVARDGIQQVLDDAGTGGEFLFSLWTFNTIANEIVEPTTDVRMVRNRLPDLGLGYVNAVQPTLWRQTGTTPDSTRNFEAYATSLTGYLATPDAAAYRHFVVLVTDGVRSMPQMTFASGQVRPIDQASCDRLKATGAEVAVIYTRYLDDHGERFFDADVGPFYGDIEPNLRACASRPGLFAMGNSPAEIHRAFADIFAEARMALYLSQ